MNYKLFIAGIISAASLLSMTSSASAQDASGTVNLAGTIEDNALVCTISNVQNGTMVEDFPVGPPSYGFGAIKTTEGSRGSLILSGGCVNVSIEGSFPNADASNGGINGTSSLFLPDGTELIITADNTTATGIYDSGFQDLQAFVSAEYNTSAGTEFLPPDEYSISVLVTATAN